MIIYFNRNIGVYALQNLGQQWNAAVEESPS